MPTLKKIVAATALVLPLATFAGTSVAQDRAWDRDRHDSRYDDRRYDDRYNNDRGTNDRYDNGGRYEREKSPREINRILAGYFHGNGTPVRRGDEYYVDVRNVHGETLYVKVNAYNGHSRYIDRREYNANVR